MGSSHRASFPHCELAQLDTVSLHLSANGALEEYDFHLDDDYHRQSHPPSLSEAVRCFIGSNHSADLGVVLSSTNRNSLSTSSLLDFVDGSLKNSFNSCSIQDDGDPLSRSHRSSCRSSRPPKRCRRPPKTIERHERVGPAASPPVPAHPRFQMQAVNFDPPSAEDQRSRQLDRLAASMKRTEASRKCVMMQREILFTPEQLRQVQDTKDELRRRLVAAMEVCRAQQGPRPDAPSSAGAMAPAPRQGADAAPQCRAMSTPRPFQHADRSRSHTRAAPANPSPVVACFLAMSQGTRAPYF